MSHALSIALIALLLSATAASQVPSQFVAGVHYKALSEPAPTLSDDRIGAIEFFLYSCPHCYAFDPQVQAWAAQLPDDVAFHRVPVTFGAAGPVYARIFYTAKALGVLDKMHSDIFDAIHQHGNPLLKTDTVRAFFVDHGVDAAAFEKTFHSKAVTQKIKAASALMRAYGVRSVPSIGVDGEYWISTRMAGSHEAMLEIADYLIQRERRQSGGKETGSQTP